MEDLVPLIIFGVIAIANLLKHVAKNKKGEREKQVRPEGPTPQQDKPSTLDDFFETIAEQMAPKPTPLPDWPDRIDRPDYVKEMEEFELTGSVETPETLPIAPQPPEPMPAPVSIVESYEVDTTTQLSPKLSTSIKTTMQSTPAVFSSTNGMRFPTTSMLDSDAAGRVDFPLKDKANLKQAIIAKLIFSPPRAYDCSFDNTIVK